MSSHTCHCKGSILFNEGRHFKCDDCNGIVDCWLCFRPATAYIDGKYVCNDHIDDDED